MQREPNSLLTLTPDARAWLCAQRPDLAAAFDGHAISPAHLAPFHPVHSVHPVHFGPVSATLHYRKPLLGDRLAALLQRLGIAAAVILLARLRGLPDCGCAARQAALNAATPRLRRLLEPWPLTMATVLSWLALLALLTRL